MKTLLLIVSLFAMLLAPMANAQKATKAFACDHCHVASMKAGKCACGMDMKAVSGRVAYVCTHCNTSSKMAGDCKMCKMPMKKSLVSYSCEHCMVSSAKAGACKKCKMPMKKHIMPIGM